MFKKFIVSIGFVLLAGSAVATAQAAAVMQVSKDITLAKGEQAPVKPGQPATPEIVVPSPDLITAGTYAFTSAAAVALEDMSSGTTQLVAASSDDGNSVLTNIGFEFWYDGVRFTQFGVNANGIARLGAAPTGSSFDNAAGFASTTNAPKIAPFYDDLCVGTNGKVHFKTIGSAPNRKLIVEWQNMQITRGAGCSGVGGGTFQMWLFESAHATQPGLIEVVYGAGMVTTAAADSGYSVGLQSGAATNFASVTTSTGTVSYAAANNTQTDAITAGTAYVFTPNIPAAPTGLSFAPITATALQLNWTDNASNEAGYAIYRSLDGVTYSFLTQTAANVVLFGDTGLSPSTTYFYRVYAVTEGALSAALSGSQATAAPGSISSTAAGGLWSVPATWVGGVVPSATDNVTIVNTATVTVDVTNAVCFGLTINGVLQSPTSGAVTNNNLTVGGNVTNNGTLDFSTNADTSAAILTFGAGASNVTFGGGGATTDVRAITVAKGAQATVVDMTVSNFTVQGVTTDVAGYLTITSGTFKISGTFAMTNRTFPGPTYTIPLLGGFWLNNPNYVVAATASAATTSNNGLLRATQGTYNIGIGAGDQMRGGTGAVFTLEGTAIINVSGAFDPQNAVTYTQTGGTMNVGVVGNNVSAFGTFELFSTTTTFNMSGGTINVITPSTGATKVDYRNNAPLATTTITGGTVVIGAAPAAAAGIYTASGTMPSTTINATQTMRVNNAAIFMRGSTVTNNGIIDYTGTSARYDFGSQVGAMTYGGAGIFGTAVTPAAGVGISANSLFLTTLNAPIFVNRVNLFTGGFVNSGMITLGSGAASTTVVQTGSAGLTTPGGSFDVSPVHNQGSGGQIVIYAQESVPRTTGVEVNPTRALTQLSVSNTNGVTIAGGDIQINGAGAGALTLTDAAVITGVNTLYFNSAAGTVLRTLSGHVDGNFKKSYAAAASKSFEVGTPNGYSPVTINATAGTFPTDITVKAVQGTEPTIMPANKAITRYWVLTATGVTADLTFTYLDPTDIPGTVTEANLNVYRMETPSAPTNLGGAGLNTAANTATVMGVTQFSNWTLAESGATPVQLQDFSVE